MIKCCWIPFKFSTCDTLSPEPHRPPHSVHPFMPLLATSSGQRQFPWPGDSEGDSSSDAEGGGDGHVASSPGTRPDNALSVWWSGPLSSAGTEDRDAAVVLEDV